MVSITAEYQISHLNKLIEAMRKELVQLANNRKSFTDPDVIKLSKKLDRLLDEYQELQYNLNFKTTWLELPRVNCRKYAYCHKISPNRRNL